MQRPLAALLRGVEQLSLSVTRQYLLQQPTVPHHIALEGGQFFPSPRDTRLSPRVIEPASEKSRSAPFSTVGYRTPLFLSNLHELDPRENKARRYSCFHVTAVRLGVWR
jgi:hypothetical protein